MIAIIASATSGKRDSGGNSAKSTNDGGSAAAPSDQGSDSGPLIKGRWNGECNQFSAGDQDACKALRVSKVTCQWQGDSVRMTIAFYNKFGAHVTVHVQPVYIGSKTAVLTARELPTWRT